MELKGIKLISGFALNSNQPLDSRAIVSSISELSSLVTEDIAYIGMIVYVNSTDDKKGLYVYNGESWKPVATSASQGDIEIPEVDLTGYATESYVNEAIGNIETSKLSLSGGGTLSGGVLNANGNILITNSNPHIGFVSGGQTAYIQTYNDNDGLGEKVGFGYGWTNSMKLDSSGNIYEKGTTLETKYALAHTHPYVPTSGGTIEGNLSVTYGIKSNSFTSVSKGTSGGMIADGSSGSILTYTRGSANAGLADYEIATKKDLKDLLTLEGTTLIIDI